VLLREEVMRGLLLGVMAVYPRAAVLVVLGEDEPDRPSAAAFTQEAVLMAVSGGAGYRDRGNPKLRIE
jgi:hypothetical protein